MLILFDLSSSHYTKLDELTLSSDSIVDVFKNLIHGFSSLQIPFLLRFKAPTSSSITEARQRTGAAVMTRLFEMVAKPKATILTQACFFGRIKNNGS